MRFIKRICLFAVVLLMFSCSNNGRKHYDIPRSKLPKVDIKIKRYGKALFEADTANFKQELKKLQLRFPVFLNGDLDDTANYNQLYEYVSDTHIIAIYKNASGSIHYVNLTKSAAITIFNS